ncbi:MAG: TadE family protein [Planctomycetota bacterium]|jgi:Flp pilus assembly protein TadG|nr:TadE family protein [Planctomycetota bacterium]
MVINKKTPRYFKLNRKGAALVEFALVAPIFLLMVFASIEIIQLNMIKKLVQEAAYFTARDAIVPGASIEDAEATAAKILGYMNTQGATISINNDGILDETSNSVTVKITVPVSDNSFLIPKLSNSMKISATATMSTERYHGYYNPD